ncbi:hypothetical protein TNCV_4658771 [Trichonephila clavipes]|nr:hypothetical protein TNCV_4658771 [Trichonephila clavipes]
MYKLVIESECESISIVTSFKIEVPVTRTISNAVGFKESSFKKVTINLRHFNKEVNVTKFIPETLPIPLRNNSSKPLTFVPQSFIREVRAALP